MKNVLFFLGICLFLISCSKDEPWSLDSNIKLNIIAHRGASFIAPENTVASVNLGWTLGADAAEIDVHLSKDNRVMVIHDGSTGRVSDVNHGIKTTNSSVLRNLDVGIWKDTRYKGEKIPFVEEIIETIPEGKVLIIEIKVGIEILPALKLAVEKSGKIQQVMFISFGWRTILETKQLFPDNRCYWLVQTKDDLYTYISQCKENGIDGVCMQAKIVNDEVMNKVSQHGLDAVAWTVNELPEAQRIIDHGITNIMTDHPGWLREELERKPQ